MNLSSVSAAPASHSLPTPGRPLRVLYADDVKELRELITVVLARDGHHVDTFENGRAALAQLTRSAEEHYDLVITDHHMPEMNGLEFVRQIRERTFPGKVVVFSSELSASVHEKYRQFAVDRILPKPIFPAQLRATLRDLFTPPPPPPA